MSDCIDDFIDVAGFLIHFPVWIIVPSEGKLDGLPRAPFKDGLGVPIFTDDDLAKRYMEWIGNPERFNLLSLDNPLSLLGFMVFLQRKGITYVLTDASKSGNTCSNDAATYIAEILRSFESDSHSRNEEG